MGRKETVSEEHQGTGVCGEILYAFGVLAHLEKELESLGRPKESIRMAIPAYVHELLLAKTCVRNCIFSKLRWRC